MNNKTFIALKQKNETDFKIVSFCSNLFKYLTQVSTDTVKFDSNKIGNKNLISVNIYNEKAELDFKEIIFVEIFGSDVNYVMFTPEIGVFKETKEKIGKNFEFDLLKMGVGKKLEGYFKTSDTFSAQRNS